MKQNISYALRRADCGLAGAIFLSLSTVAAVAVYNPNQVKNAPERPKVLSAVEHVATSPVLPVSLPAIVPAPRPQPILTRLRIEVALADLATETNCLAEAIYYEARGEGMMGEKAIAEVVVHRTHRVGYPHSICGVVHQGAGDACQFSFVCNGMMDQPRTPGEWSRAVRLATRILTGALPLTDITNGAIAFHASGVEPSWPGLVRTVQIGNHVFYRRPARSHST
ncbi:MAG TPA: cell wall hydrolase [Rhizomicrobium sp.]|jgi:Cell Wall Hydrolase|nr:cell wall hydrolase [Rhizomicrobium sp.]